MARDIRYEPGVDRASYWATICILAETATDSLVVGLIKFSVNIWNYENQPYARILWGPLLS